MSRRLGLILVMVAMIAAIYGCSGDDGPMGPAGPAGPSAIVGYASIYAVTDSTSVLAFGGGATDSVTVSGNNGNHLVTFHGDYAGLTEVADLTVLATVSDTDNFHVSSASMDQGSASETAITVRVFTWSTSVTPNPIVPANFSVVVMR